MNRRGFLGMLGRGATVGLVAPSMLWPFRKIFLPLSIPRSRIDFLDLSRWGTVTMHDSAFEVGDTLLVIQHRYNALGELVVDCDELKCCVTRVKSQNFFLSPQIQEPYGSRETERFAKTIQSLAGRDLKTGRASLG